MDGDVATMLLGKGRMEGCRAAAYVHRELQRHLPVWGGERFVHPIWIYCCWRGTAHGGCTLFPSLPHHSPGHVCQSRTICQQHTLLWGMGATHTIIVMRCNRQTQVPTGVDNAQRVAAAHHGGAPQPS